MRTATFPVNLSGKLLQLGRELDEPVPVQSMPQGVKTFDLPINFLSNLVQKLGKILLDNGLPAVIAIVEKIFSPEQAASVVAEIIKPQVGILPNSIQIALKSLVTDKWFEAILNGFDQWTKDFLKALAEHL